MITLGLPYFSIVNIKAFKIVKLDLFFNFDKFKIALLPLSIIPNIVFLFLLIVVTFVKSIFQITFFAIGLGILCLSLLRKCNIL